MSRLKDFAVSSKQCPSIDNDEKNDGIFLFFFNVFGCLENPDEARSPSSVQLHVVYDVSKGLNL